MKPIASSPSYGLTLLRKLVNLIAGAGILALFVVLCMLAYSMSTSDFNNEPPPPLTHTQPKMTTETVVMIEKVPYGMCYVTKTSNVPICEARKNITTYRYELLEDGDIILRDDSVVNQIVIDGYVDDCGNFYEQQPPTYKIVYPSVKIEPSRATHNNGFVRNYR